MMTALNNLAPASKNTVPTTARISDSDIIILVTNGDLNAFELIMRRYNQRLFRIARGILKDDNEAEDIVQETYIKAFTLLDTLDGPKHLGAWLSKITMNEALMRLRKNRNTPNPTSNYDDSTQFIPQQLNPERIAENIQFRKLLETAIDNLPENFRLVFLLRGVEQLSIAETAQCLNIKPATVKTRFHRAKNLLKNQLKYNIDKAILNTFEFGGLRCNRIVDRVLSILSVQQAAL